MEATVARLTTRVFELESRNVSPTPQATWEEASPTRSYPVAEEKQAGNILTDEVMPTTAEPGSEQENIAREIFVPAATFGTKLRGVLGEGEWEALVGGSLLNKIGALVLVIGLALFLSYSLTHMSPAGRALTCVAASWSLLGSGVLIERKQTYRIFARGLIGAGWAALYITAYAIYAVPAARLIENPFVGSLLLLVVAVGMIGHSLLYRRQGVTAVAYFAAFAALSVTPSSSFALVSLLPLAASLLYLAFRFRWSAMAVFGLVATYGSCLWRGEASASLLADESLLVVYWLLFEGFDLIRVRGQRSDASLQLVFPLNAFAFLGLSYSAWGLKNPGEVWLACAFAALFFLASAVARWSLRPQDRALNLVDVAGRMRAGSFEAPLALSAVLSGISITLRAVGVWLSAGLAMEAEVLYFSGVMLDLGFLRLLGRAGFTASLGRLIGNDISSNEVLPGTMAGVHVWTPIALVHAFLFYLDRLLRTPNVVFSSVAAALIAAVFVRELPDRFIGTAWLVFGACLLEIGVRKMRSEFRFQAYALAAGGVALNLWLHVTGAWPHPAIPLGLALCIVYGILIRVRHGAVLPAREQTWLEVATAAAISSLSMLLVWRTGPEHFRGVLLCALAVVLFELGRRELPRQLIQCSYLAGIVAAGSVVAEQWVSFVKFPHAFVWISYAGAAVLAYVFSERVDRKAFPVRVAVSLVAAVFELCTLWLIVPQHWVAVSWAAVAFLLFQSGLRFKRTWERVIGFSIMLAAMGEAASARFPWPSLAVACFCFASEFLSPRESEFPGGSESIPAERHVRVFWSVMGTLVLSALLWEKFPGGLLTTAWGVQGVALLVTGFLFRERILRLEGLAVLLLCILKLFIYDLRSLETIYRILSFIALGVILLGVSSLYARFRKEGKEHL